MLHINLHINFFNKIVKKERKKIYNVIRPLKHSGARHFRGVGRSMVIESCALCQA